MLTKLRMAWEEDDTCDRVTPSQSYVLHAAWSRRSLLDDIPAQAPINMRIQGSVVESEHFAADGTYLSVRRKLSRWTFALRTRWLDGWRFRFLSLPHHPQF